MSRTAMLLGLLLGVVAETRAGVSVSVTTCGQVVPPGARAVLANDIACPPWGVCYPSCVPPNPGCSQPLQPVVTCRSTAECPDPPNDNCASPPGIATSVGIYLGKGARLAMNSHSVSGAFIGIVSGNPQGTGAGKMQITGPGSIFGNQYGLFSTRARSRSKASRCTTMCTSPISGSGRVTLEDVVGSDNEALAIAAKRMTATAGHGHGQRHRARFGRLAERRRLQHHRQHGRGHRERPPAPPAERRLREERADHPAPEHAGPALGRLQQRLTRPVTVAARGDAGRSADSRTSPADVRAAPAAGRSASTSTATADAPAATTSIVVCARAAQSGSSAAAASLRVRRA